MFGVYSVSTVFTRDIAHYRMSRKISLPMVQTCMTSYQTRKLVGIHPSHMWETSRVKQENGNIYTVIAALAVITDVTSLLAPTIFKSSLN